MCRWRGGSIIICAQIKTMGIGNFLCLLLNAGWLRKVLIWARYHSTLVTHIMLSVVIAKQGMIGMCPRDLERLIFEEYDEGFIFRLA
jgi:hypothetical protein